MKTVEQLKIERDLAKSRYDLLVLSAQSSDDAWNVAHSYYYDEMVGPHYVTQEDHKDNHSICNTLEVTLREDRRAAEYAYQEYLAAESVLYDSVQKILATA